MPNPIGGAVGGGEITRLLADVRAGDRMARDTLCAKVYPELRRLAAAYLRGERSGHSLQPTVLVHDAYMGLIGQDKTFANRNHFFAVAANLMRRLLVDHARAIRAEKRGGGSHPAALNENIEGSNVRMDNVLAVDEALNRLHDLDQRQSRVVEMKIFAGLSEEEIADVLEVSSRTVKRDWKVAKIWLSRQLSR